jgi:hypothetical protein
MQHTPTLQEVDDLSETWEDDQRGHAHSDVLAMTGTAAKNGAKGSPTLEFAAGVDGFMKGQRRCSQSLSLEAFCIAVIRIQRSSQRCSECDIVLWFYTPSALLMSLAVSQSVS